MRASREHPHHNPVIHTASLGELGAVPYPLNTQYVSIGKLEKYTWYVYVR